MTVNDFCLPDLSSHYCGGVRGWNSVIVKYTFRVKHIPG